MNTMFDLQQYALQELKDTYTEHEIKVLCSLTFCKLLHCTNIDPFSGTRAACERANVILTVSCAFEKRHSFAVLRPQARAGANRAQARLLGRRLGSGAIGVTRKKT